jgi:hypothetical protein
MAGASFHRQGDNVKKLFFSSSLTLWQNELKRVSFPLLFCCNVSNEQKEVYIFNTSKSHATYLKQWAVEWDMPIISIDYSLAPDAPYPRALEEVLYAYAW